MRANSIRRLAGGAAALAIVGATILSSASLVTAAPPKWTMNVVALPSAVSPGAAAGYRVVINNTGPSNISALYLVSNLNQSTAYILSDREGTCAASGALSCAFGALNSGTSVGITVAYTTPANGSSFAVQFQANTTGSTFSDTKGRSHGDTLTTTGTTSLNATRDFAGAFSALDGTTVANNASLTGSNKQATKVAGLGVGATATVQDGPNRTFACATTAEVDCSKLMGEWSEVHVANAGAPFTIVITFKTGTPTGFVHLLDNGSQEYVGPCPAAVAGKPCFTFSGNQATIFTTYNGSWRGL